MTTSTDNNTGLTPRGTEFLPKPFSGENISNAAAKAHLFQFKSYLEYRNITNENDKIKRFGSTLSGKALDWFISKEHTGTFTALKEDFLKKFSGFRSRDKAVNMFNNLV